MYADNSSATGTPAITITRGQFNSNGYDGMRLLSRGSITITNAEANSNDTNHGDTSYYYGAFINNTSGSGNVTIKSSSPNISYSYRYNTLDGIYINSYGTVSVSNVNASDNGRHGIIIMNNYAASAKNVSVTRCVTSSNPNYGLDIATIGSVILDSIQANENGENGTYPGLFIDACQYSGGCRGTGSITLKGSNNQFNDNTSYGIDASSSGSMTLQNFTADGNMYSGINLYNAYPGSTGSVTISAGSKDFNFALNNDSNGVSIQSNGTISISRLSVNHNLNIGAYIRNSTSVTPKSVTLTDCYFDSNEGTGVDIWTNGLVTFNGVDASYNSIHKGTLDEDAGETIHERLTSDTNNDYWWFTGEAGDNYTIKLLDTQFSGVLYLYDEYNNLIGFDDASPSGNHGTDIEIDVTGLSTTSDYYLRITSADGNVGDYTLSFNSGARLQYSDYYGAYIRNSYGTGGVTVKSTSQCVVFFQ